MRSGAPRSVFRAQPRRRRASPLLARAGLANSHHGWELGWERLSSRAAPSCSAADAFFRVFHHADAHGVASASGAGRPKSRAWHHCWRTPCRCASAAPLRLNSLCRRWLIDTTVTQTRPLCSCSLRGAPPPCCRRAGGRAAGRPLPAQARRRRGGAQDAALLGRVALCGWAQLGAGAAGTKGAERRDHPHALARGQVHLHSHKHAASWCSECSRRRGWGAPRARG